ncbi:MAG TPA: hypothetical protein VF134_09710, partial [Candidatus Dormibacteraeota bacterium]
LHRKVAASAWVEPHASHCMARPDDVCPFERPFPEGFDRCPAYGETDYVALDMQYRPLATLKTCRHLQVGTLSGRLTGFYPRCGLGNAEARRRWVERVHADRINQLRVLSSQLAAATSELTRELWEAKGDQLRAIRAGHRGATATRRMRRLVRAYEDATREFFDANAGELARIGLPADPLLELVRDALEEWVTRPSLEGNWQASESLLRRFSPEVRAFLQPHPSRRAG